jgi:cardiolipin synthase
MYDKEITLELEQDFLRDCGKSIQINCQEHLKRP